MTRPHLAALRPCLPALVAVAALAALLVAATGASAKGSPQFRRGHLPAIGEIKLAKQKGGRAEIVVPVTYTRALSGHPSGLESSEVTLHIARKVEGRSAVGVTLTRTHHHTILGTGTVIDRFRLDRRTSDWLLNRPRKERGRLVRIDVRHQIKQRRGGRPLHEKDASLTMASSHQARPAGESGLLTLRNDTAAPIHTVSTPILCMYTEGEHGSNLQAFTTSEGAAVPPGGTIEANVEADGNLFDSAEYQGPSGESAGRYFDREGIELEVIAAAFDVELTPFSLLIAITSNCTAQASTFQLAAASSQGEAVSSEAWVLTGENCSRGCPSQHLVSAYGALQFQNTGGEGTGPGVWAHESTSILEALAGGWREPPIGGKIVQDDGLHWRWQELPEIEESMTVYDFEQYEEIVTSTKSWEVSVHEGSSPVGFSG
jgi:hypothetical protein